MRRTPSGDVEMRWIDAYFPFTEPSYELEIFFKGEWLEVLGCGVMQQEILDKNGRAGTKAWAFGYGPCWRSSLHDTSCWCWCHAHFYQTVGSDSATPSNCRLGLERLAMVLFNIPDIRLFWTSDQRFLKQFRTGDFSAKFTPYSRYPPCFKDVSFWLSDSFTENNLCELVRSVAGDLVEEVKCIDNFTHPKTVRPLTPLKEMARCGIDIPRDCTTVCLSLRIDSLALSNAKPSVDLQGRTSHCYRIAYRSMDRSLTDEEINALQEQVRL